MDGSVLFVLSSLSLTAMESEAKAVSPRVAAGCSGEAEQPFSWLAGCIARTKKKPRFHGALGSRYQVRQNLP